MPRPPKTRITRGWALHIARGKFGQHGHAWEEIHHMAAGGKVQLFKIGLYLPGGQAVIKGCGPSWDAAVADMHSRELQK